jgi:hypothetical protein
MEGKPDRLSANRMCDLTGVRAQTRASWVERGLLRVAKNYGELDVIEQAVLKELLARLQKSHVSLAWDETQRHLRGAVVGPDAVLVWDPGARRVHITSDDAELRRAVCHGRQVHVLALGELVGEARRLYRLEVAARTRAQEAKGGRGRGTMGRARGA